MNKKINAEMAIRIIARNNGTTVEKVKTHIKLAILSGLSNPDPVVQARWKKIPCEGELPTPEELIAFLAKNVDTGIDPFK